MARIKIMMNGIPGKVAVTIAGHAKNDDRFTLLPYSMTGPEITDKAYDLEGMEIALFTPAKREAAIERIKEKEGHFISIDFTHPLAVNSNADFYGKNNLPFVMGTTGGDRRLLEKTVQASSISAVIAPNMAKQIVGFQAMMAFAATTFPDIFKDYSLTITESHQSTKADTSGTAKAMVGHFNRMGIPFENKDIVQVRDPDVQENKMGIPREFINGHAWHTYALVSKDKSVQFEFKHNVNGRNVYADGTLDAVVYLSHKTDARIKGRVFTMIDVLQKE